MKILKIAILSLGLVALTPSVHAQKIGVRAGINYANVSGEADTEALTGFYAGLFKEVTLVPELFFLQPEVQYSMQGFKFEDTNYTIGYVNVPVVGKVYLAKIISFEAGPQVGFKVSDNFPEGSPDLKTVDMGIAGGIGLNFPFGLSINARYIQGFTDIQEEVEGKNQVLQLGAAFKF
ncbi:PorT family protein [Flavobacterium sp. CYK-4]|uniref:porin family protein n=1 Tax=Flavobacterium lotistagni TaxID=2709660 RepID=UPI00140B4C1B|nr:porin family protein [Flavobacterium lotistagni]NHM07815.1 PorT family protein [Flavobacterium lotistagni]